MPCFRINIKSKKTNIKPITMTHTSYAVNMFYKVFQKVHITYFAILSLFKKYYLKSATATTSKTIHHSSRSIIVCTNTNKNRFLRIYCHATPLFMLVCFYSKYMYIYTYMCILTASNCCKFFFIYFMNVSRRKTKKFFFALLFIFSCVNNRFAMLENIKCLHF